jgi:tetratricopeptide (TPR) repeat protein
MPSLEELMQELAALDAKHDLDGLRRVREQIVAEHGATEPAVEALYKIGLDLLFRERKIDLAVDKFSEAAKRKQPFWSDAARTSLGLCYYHQRRTQKALLELRKVGYVETPNAHSITALAFIENIYLSEANRAEAAKARKDRIGQLEHLIKTLGKGKVGERGYYMFQLGLALKDSGDDERAKAILSEAKGYGPDQLGADVYRSILDALG